MKSPAFLEELSRRHVDLLHGKVDRGVGFTDLVYQPLCDYLECHYRAVPADVVNDAVADAILAYLEKPVRANANTGGHVWAHLLRAAWCNVRDAQRKANRRCRAEARYALEEQLRTEERERRVVDLLVNCHSAAESTASHLSGEQKGLDGGRTDADREIWQLMKEGERRTWVFAEVLGITALAPLVQRLEVRRAKERIRQRQKRSMLRG